MLRLGRYEQTRAEFFLNRALDFDAKGRHMLATIPDWYPAASRRIVEENAARVFRLAEHAFRMAAQFEAADQTAGGRSNP